MTSTNAEPPDPRKAQARALSARPGMSYAAALRQVVGSAQPWQPKHRWVLTDEVRDWLSGDSRRGDRRDLYAWLDNLPATFACDLCGEPGDARTADCAITPVVTAYDPDFAPVTRHVTTRKYHATCKPSSMDWVPETELPPGPLYLGLRAADRPDLIGTVDFGVHALLDTDPEDGIRHAMLLLTARIVEDHGRGVFPWSTELELYLGSQGITSLAALDDDDEPAWTLRISTENTVGNRPPWIAIRIGHGGYDDTPRHLLLREVDLPDGWADAARRAGHVDVAVGLCTRHWDTAPVPEELADGIADIIKELSFITKTAADNHCDCALLTADHAVALVESGAFLLGWVRVLSDDGIG
ncbi:hypothetical protein [Umezawaea sp. Da 62-37]|uniref:hypothetical protein n=1 Tax=Umezawaea sp. Da 62-37 TaxID=3075927 RepID=UPI0028F71C3E|nr:hypothetical protein [Umezawaea sp. Da 62-37]WNV83154.1 hypothetical protein RM788_33890 [Umezawaea sp. Da 62-37]